MIEDFKKTWLYGIVATTAITAACTYAIIQAVRIEPLKEDYERLKVQVETLQISKDDLKEDHERLKVKVETLQNNANGCDDNVNFEKNKEIAILKDRLQKLNSEFEIKNRENIDLLMRLKILEKSIAEESTVNTKSDSSHKELDSRVHHLEKGGKYIGLLLQGAKKHRIIIKINSIKEDNSFSGTINFPELNAIKSIIGEIIGDRIIFNEEKLVSGSSASAFIGISYDLKLNTESDSKELVGEWKYRSDGGIVNIDL